LFETVGIIVLLSPGSIPKRIMMIIMMSFFQVVYINLRMINVFSKDPSKNE